jgi:hypothetical protein
MTILETNPKPKADDYINLHGFKAICNSAKGIAPFLQNEISYRVHKQLACNIAVVGEARLGKSYLSFDLCRVHEGLDKDGNDRFTTNQIVYSYQDYMNLVLTLPIGRFIFFDEPSYSIGNRTWQNDLQQTLVSTVESSGYKVHPLVIACINLALIDKKIRNYLIQFLCIMSDRGHATVYKVSPSEFTSKIYYQYFCEVRYSMLDLDKCAKPTCLGCGSLLTCNVFRAQYERKKQLTQDARYEQGLEDSARKENAILTDKQIEEKAILLKELWFENQRINVNKLIMCLADTFHIHLSTTHAYRIKSALELHYQNELNQES